MSHKLKAGAYAYDSTSSITEMPRVANTDQTFKKSSVVVGQPAVTDHNINDDYVKDPPQVVSTKFFNISQGLLMSSIEYR